MTYKPTGDQKRDMAFKNAMLICQTYLDTLIRCHARKEFGTIRLEFDAGAGVIRKAKGGFTRENSQHLHNGFGALTREEAIEFCASTIQEMTPLAFHGSRVIEMSFMGDDLMIVGQVNQRTYKLDEATLEPGAILV